MSVERDNEIVKLYTEKGFSQASIGQRFGISKARIGQILHKHGVTRTSRMSTNEGRSRSAYIGVFVTPDIKRALGEEARLCESSISALVAEFITKELTDRGVDFTPVFDDSPRLPLEND